MFDTKNEELSAIQLTLLIVVYNYTIFKTLNTKLSFAGDATQWIFSYSFSITLRLLQIRKNCAELFAHILTLFIAIRDFRHWYEVCQHIDWFPKYTWVSILIYKVIMHTCITILNIDDTYIVYIFSLLLLLIFSPLICRLKYVGMHNNCEYANIHVYY